MPPLCAILVAKRGGCMKIKELYGRGRAVLSFEIFPPKKEGTLDSVFPTIEQLQVLKFWVKYGLQEMKEKKIE